MVKVSSSGATKVSTMVISTRIIFMVKESMFGLTAESTMASGLTTKWKEQVPSPGVMVEDTLDNIKMIKNMVTEHSIGQTVESILVNGAKASSTVKELISKRERRDLVSGKWEKESNGLRKDKLINDINNSKIQSTVSHYI